LPGIFDPVRDGDRLDVDGALVDHLPTDLARQMGPDVVIASHLQVAPATADEICLASPLHRGLSFLFKVN
jgi:NTE family protein